MHIRSDVHWTVRFPCYLFPQATGPGPRLFGVFDVVSRFQHYQFGGWRDAKAFRTCFEAVKAAHADTVTRIKTVFDASAMAAQTPEPDLDALREAHERSLETELYTEVEVDGTIGTWLAHCADHVHDKASFTSPEHALSPEDMLRVVDLLEAMDRAQRPA